jgi:hypothetical protein
MARAGDEQVLEGDGSGRLIDRLPPSDDSPAS